VGLPGERRDVLHGADRLYIILRFAWRRRGRSPVQCSNVPLTGLNTFLLICSSVSMVKAYAAIADGKKYFLRKVPGKTLQDGGLKFWMLVTIICGAGFVGVQVIEYIKLVGEGFTPAGYRAASLLAEHAAAIRSSTAWVWRGCMDRRSSP